MSTTITQVAETVSRRAQRQGYIVPKDIRAELRQAGLPEEQWKEVVGQLKQTLNYRQGRYYHVAAVSPRLHQELEQQRRIQKTIKSLIKDQRDAAKAQERRGAARVDFIQPIQVRTEDGKEFTLVSRDLSPTGIRLLGTRRLLGQKVEVRLTTKAAVVAILTRILWTCAIGDGLFENGGSFLEILNHKA